MSPDRSGSNMLRAGAAEFVGTFILVFAGTAAASAAALGRPIAGGAYESLAVGLVFGLVLIALVSALGHVSGAHFNTAVTVSLLSARKMPGSYAAAYIVAQLLGAITAAAAVWATFGDPAREQAALGATLPVPGADYGQVFLMEFIATFMLILVIMAVATDDRANKAAASVAIGLALGVGVLIAGPVTGGSLNPARTLGPMIVSGRFDGVWIYILAPILGGICAALLYKYFIGKASPPPPEEETSVLGEAT